MLSKKEFSDFLMGEANELLHLRLGREQRSHIFSVEKNRRDGAQTKLFDGKVLVEGDRATAGPSLIFYKGTHGSSLSYDI